ncbi:hypothetical protein KC330_g43 [Hortaea werneckii]|nr:hypothetical protein KC330_g43 [Hortaea werneckii]
MSSIFVLFVTSGYVARGLGTRDFTRVLRLNVHRLQEQFNRSFSSNVSVRFNPLLPLEETKTHGSFGKKHLEQHGALKDLRISIISGRAKDGWQSIGEQWVLPSSEHIYYSDRQRDVFDRELLPEKKGQGRETLQTARISTESVPRYKRLAATAAGPKALHSAVNRQSRSSQPVIITCFEQHVERPPSATLASGVDFGTKNSLPFSLFAYTHMLDTVSKPQRPTSKRECQVTGTCDSLARYYYQAHGSDLADFYASQELNKSAKLNVSPGKGLRRSHQRHIRPVVSHWCGDGRWSGDVEDAVADIRVDEGFHSQGAHGFEEVRLIRAGDGLAGLKASNVIQRRWESRTSIASLALMPCRPAIEARHSRKVSTEVFRFGVAPRHGAMSRASHTCVRARPSTFGKANRIADVLEAAGHSAKKDRAVIQRLCRSRVVAVNLSARTLVKIKIDRFTADPSSGFFGSAVLSSTSSTDWIPNPALMSGAMRIHVIACRVSAAFTNAK